MRVSAPHCFDQSEPQVEAMMDQGTPFSDVEDVIDAAVGLSTDHKAALWLLAWSLRDTEQQRQEARLMLAHFGRRQLGGPVMQRPRKLSQRRASPSQQRPGSRRGPGAHN